MGRDGKKGRGGGRGHKGGRGGGERMYIDNIDELQRREQQVQEQRDARLRRRGEKEEDNEAEGGEEEGGEEQQQKPDSVFSFDKKAPKAAGEGEEEDEELKGGLLGHKNPNHARKAAEGDESAETGMNRREREAFAANKAKEDYMKRHLAGETEQARADLARLAIIRARREEAAKKREVEGKPAGMSAFGIEASESSEEEDDSDEEEEDSKAKKPVKTAPAPAPAPVPVAPKLSEAAAKKRAAASGDSEVTAEKTADGGPAKLKSMDIKKMNADAVKEHLKERGLSIQGQKKDLMQRLIDHEAARP
jgi:hypothetical protein